MHCSRLETCAIALTAVLLLTSASGCTASKTTPPQGIQQSSQLNSTSLLENGPMQSLSQTGTPKLLDGKESTLRTNKALSLADLHHKYKSTFLFSGPTSKRQVSLTFDDVPDLIYTPQILDILHNYGVRATFFVVGNRAAAHPEIIRRMVRDGHAIGSHTFTHPNCNKVSDTKFQNEITRTEQTLANITGYKPTLFRPPYGNVTEQQILWLASQQYHIINWNVDSLDWKGLNADQVSANILGHVRPGSVILQHAGGGEGEDLTGTVQALPHIIENLHTQGIDMVTIPELFHISAGK
ncbi:polysaccharide deacetylase family protein [Paenibacillus rigui]|uniref:Chitooligosaccharide deacetylase n=1 Tax=Paenibacillus rigui TaxID=554312 RepID=A0A229UWN8_9BACL|nr:polysaccharide deacetylase family protein [Paenibacillus rigui]OXM87790.1 chitooligosaccharide deacetylase [Paenibacillus rigui]